MTLIFEKMQRAELKPTPANTYRIVCHEGGEGVPAFFSRFTERAQRALHGAQEEARAMGHNYVGTEHLLLGLLKEKGGAAATVLGENISLEKVRAHVTQLVGKGDFAFTESFGHTPRTKKVLELSLYEANRLGHNYIGTEYCLRLSGSRKA